MIPSRGSHSCAYRLACAGRVFACAPGKEGTFSYDGYGHYAQDAMHLTDNAGVDVCSGACSTEELSG